MKFLSEFKIMEPQSLCSLPYFLLPVVSMIKYIYKSVPSYIISNPNDLLIYKNIRMCSTTSKHCTTASLCFFNLRLSFGYTSLFYLYWHNILLIGKTFL